MSDRALSASSPIAAALLAWHAREGRRELPWLRERTAYRVWVSEIMLQQTRVAAVIPYFERFMARFPDIRSLADTPLDEVLHLWSGLGYYARARNLQRAAVRVRDEYGGELPGDFAALADLPGIGRSTAGAILALGHDQPFPILDGNVRRVLSRHFAIARERAGRSVTQQLWELSARCTPTDEVARYTQAIMDLGATVCVHRKPLCGRCPLAHGCIARRTGRQHELPPPRRARPHPSRRVFMLLALHDSGDVLLERRPPGGVWGGLWCLPQFDTVTAAGAFARDNLGAEGAPRPLAEIEHAFTHFSLVVTPLVVRCSGAPAVMDADSSIWYNPRDPARIGLPAPVAALLSSVAGESLLDALRGP